MFRLLLSPRLIGLHMMALVATTAASWLGLWQYDAWQASRDAEATDLANAKPKLLENVMSPDDPFPGNAIGQPVQFAGEWAREATFLVAERELEGRTGYWVVTPVAVCRDRCETSPAMLVVRGWTPQPGDFPDSPAGRVQVTGWLQPPEGTGRPDPNPSDDVLPELRIADAIQRVDQDLYGAYVIAEDLDSTTSTHGERSTADAAGGLAPVTPDSLPEPETLTAVRNLLYAFEWWAFGGFALFVWWRWCADAVGETQSVATPPQADDAAASTLGPDGRSAVKPAAKSLR